MDQERIDAVWGRYLVPEERPFNKNLPPAKRKPKLKPESSELQIIDFDLINQTKKLLENYIQFVSTICHHGDDGHHGTTVKLDVSALEVMARRIHYAGLFVAEYKFQSNRFGYSKLILEGNNKGLLEKLTVKERESEILERVEKKVESIQEKSDRNIRRELDPKAVVAFYKNTIIPLTKKAEVQYLLNRNAMGMELDQGKSYNLTFMLSNNNLSWSTGYDPKKISEKKLVGKLIEIIGDHLYFMDAENKRHNLRRETIKNIRYS